MNKLLSQKLEGEVFSEVNYVEGLCQKCGPTTKEKVGVHLGMVDWEFFTCMDCGKIERYVTEFDENGNMVSC
jgi:hypothetical protein